MYAYIDETGNTGQNIFDEAQPEFITAALVTRVNFDVLYERQVKSIAKKIGVDALHANEIGIAKAESIADDIQEVLKKADARLLVSIVEKKYLAVTKIVDYIFDSGENKAVPWQAYNLRPLRLLLVFKIASIVDYEIARIFWSSLMEKKKGVAYEKYVQACELLRQRVGDLPDHRSREIVSDALGWAIENFEAIRIHSSSRISRYGHFPNMVGFQNLIDGLEDQSRRWGRAVKLIVHDAQLEFERNLKELHSIYSNASPDPLYWPGDEPRVLRSVFGSAFRMATENESVGIQVVDLLLWLFKRYRENKSVGYRSVDLLHFATKRGRYQDFSFEGVGMQLEEHIRRANSANLSEEQMNWAYSMLKEEELRRQNRMLEHSQRKLQ